MRSSGPETSAATTGPRGVPWGTRLPQEEPMPRLTQVPRDAAPDDVRQIYDMLFGGRDPVAEPGVPGLKRPPQ